MSGSLTRGIVALACLLLNSALFAQETYEPLTLDEARAYVAQKPEEAAQDIVRLDAMEHTAPLVKPTLAAVVVGARDVAVSWPAPWLFVTGPYQWTLTIEPIIAKDVVPQSHSFRDGLLIGGAAGLLVGGGVSLLTR